MNRPEQDLQRAALKFLTLLLGRDYIVLHAPNGGARSPREAAILKGLGVRAGAPDLLIQGRAFSGWIELKAAAGRLAADQEAFRDDCAARGISWVECRNLIDIESAVIAWGLAELRDGALRPTRGRGVPAMGGPEGSAGRGEPAVRADLRGVSGADGGA